MFTKTEVNGVDFDTVHLRDVGVIVDGKPDREERAVIDQAERLSFLTLGLCRSRVVSQWRYVIQLLSHQSWPHSF